MTDISRLARQQATAAKRERELAIADNFTKKFITQALNPHNINERADALNMSKREIRDTFGRSAANVWPIMFSLLSRGGRSAETGESWKSKWVPNPNAMPILAEWCKVDETLKQLEERLAAAQVTSTVWVGSTKSWQDKAVLDAATAARRRRRSAARKYIESPCKRTLEENELYQAMK